MRAKKINGRGSVTPLAIIARMTRILGEGRVPDAVAFIMAAGSLTAINKLTAKQNQDLRDQNKQPKLRPANGGTTALKTGLKLATLTPSGKRAIAGL